MLLRMANGIKLVITLVTNDGSLLLTDNDARLSELERILIGMSNAIKLGSHLAPMMPRCF